jgi:hypothetical protein
MSRFIDVFQFTGSQMQEKGNFFALMFLVMGIGALVVYFVVGWCSNVVAQVRHTIQWLLFRCYRSLRFGSRSITSIGGRSSATC